MNLLLAADHGTTHPKWVHTVMIIKQRKRTHYVVRSVARIYRRDTVHEKDCSLTGIQTIVFKGLVVLDDKVAGRYENKQIMRLVN